MGLIALVFTVLLAVAPAAAQEAQPPSSREKPSSAPKDKEPTLPVSLDKIKEGLAQPPSALTLRSLDETPTFRMQIIERLRVEELLSSIFLKTTPGPLGGYSPAGGVYGYEQQKQMFPAVN